MDAATRLLEDFGVSFAPAGMAGSPEAALAAARRLGYPIVLKTARADILHKSDVGGVVLNVDGDEKLSAAYRQLADGFGPGVLVQKQAERGVEFFLGMVRDPIVGPTLRFGLGGVFIEIFRDFVTAIPPVDGDLAGRLLARLKGHQLLQGARGTPPVNLTALSETIARFSVLCRELGPMISEIDVNPLILRPDGITAVDALVIVDPIET